MKKQSGEKSAFEAMCDAQRLACAPFEFEAAVCLRDFGILAFLDGAGDAGAELSEIEKASGQSPYAVRALLEAGKGAELVREEGGRWSLTKTGWFLQNDGLTRANFNFAADVCYRGLASLKESFEESRPAGLKELAPGSATIYPVLRSLPEPARKSWFEYDHYFSDAAYRACLPHVFESGPKAIYDVGGNSGKWSVLCAKENPSVRMTVIDLPPQCALALENARAAGVGDRVDAFAADMLSDPALPAEADIWWMSQFLDCFGGEDIVRILKLVARTMKPGARIFVLEPLIGCQPFAAGDRCLSAFSLYFTAMANGTSRFYTLSEFEGFVAAAGLAVEKAVHGLGIGHTLLVLRSGREEAA